MLLHTDNLRVSLIYLLRSNTKFIDFISDMNYYKSLFAC